MSNQRRNWKKLRVGDRIRIVAIPQGDQRQYEESGDDFTVRVLRRLIRKKSAVRIGMIDDFSYPWLHYRFRNSRGKIEDHSLSVSDNESWRYAIRRHEDRRP